MLTTTHCANLVMVIPSSVKALVERYVIFLCHGDCLTSHLRKDWKKLSTKISELNNNAKFSENPIKPTCGKDRLPIVNGKWRWLAMQRQQKWKARLRFITLLYVQDIWFYGWKIYMRWCVVEKMKIKCVTFICLLN